MRRLSTVVSGKKDEINNEDIKMLSNKETSKKSKKMKPTKIKNIRNSITTLGNRID